MAPFFYLVPAWLAGIFLQGWLGLPIVWLLFGLLGAVGFAGLGFWQKSVQAQSAQTGSRTLARNMISPKVFWLVALGVATMLLGGLRYESAQPPDGPTGVLYYVNQPNITILGVVVDEPVYTAKTDSYRLRVRQILPSGEAATPVEAQGEVFVRAALYPERQPGDLLELQGTLKLPKEIEGDGFPYRDYLARQGLYVTLDYPRGRLLTTGQDQKFFLLGWLASAREGARQIIKASVPGDEGDLLVAVLLGDRQNLSRAIKQDFQLSDTVHILAISGSNITITIGLMLLVLRRLFKRKTALTIAMLGAVLYVLLLGASPSAIRGGLMGAMAIIGILLGREYYGLLGLHAAALLMTLFQPRVLWDIGFELSFLGTLGLFVIARPLEDKMRGWPVIVREGVALTIAAELTTLPLTMYYFHQLSFVAIFANLFGVPALELVLATGGLTVLGGWLWGPLGVGLGWVAWVFAAYLLGTVHFFAQLAFGHAIVPEFHPVWIGIYYIGLAFGLVWWRDEQKRLQKWLGAATKSRWVMAGLVVAFVLVWGAVGFNWLYNQN